MIRTALSPLVSPASARYHRELLLIRRAFELMRSKMPSAERTLEKRFETLRTSFFESYWSGVARDLGASIDAFGDGFYRLSRGGKSTFVRQGEVMIDDHLTLRIAGNKPLVNRLLHEQGYTVPAFVEYDLRNMAEAIRFMLDCGGNCVVKPASGAAGGRGVTTKINHSSRLRQASYRAAIHSSNAKLMIEEEHAGGNYRLLYLDGRFIDAIRREAPTLVGDGRSTIQTLVDRENVDRLREGNLALSPLTLDLDARYTLAEQGLSARDVVPSGTRVRVKTASNQYSRKDNRTVKDSVHPSIVDFGRDVSRVLGVTLSGVDLMLKDHTLPLHESQYRLNEINTTPGLHHHALISNDSSEVTVGSVIVDYIFNKDETG
jgi:D-alanine-D-alanine ligase-like ATP-grasp enzyme